jgi:predicted negative regulator of RcsB-dependent stress response
MSMAYDLEEQEQIEALKDWWKHNGRLVLLAVLAALIAFAAVTGWRYYKDQQSAQASQLYGELEKAVQASDTRKINEVAGQIIDRYGRTAYAPMAALVAAKASVDAGDLKTAGSRLAWAVEHARDEETAAVARLRLAAVRLDEKQYEEALRLLEQKHPEAFSGLYADLRGDVLVAQGKLAEARAAYKQALEKLAPETTYRLIVQAKLDGIGGVN